MSLKAIDSSMLLLTWLFGDSSEIIILKFITGLKFILCLIE
jgi:hypothetical protein